MKSKPCDWKPFYCENWEYPLPLNLIQIIQSDWLTKTDLRRKYVEQNVMVFVKKKGPIIFSFFSDMVSAASAWTTCATVRAETSFETAPEAFRHEPVDDWVQTAEIVIKIILFMPFYWKLIN